MSSMDIRGILEYLPHRYPFLLVDRVLEIVDGKSIVAIKNITMNEQFFTGHFPSLPVMPGVLQVEALAQAAGILSFKSSGRKNDNNSLYYFVGIDNARFKRPVTPGDQLRLDVSITRESRSIWKYRGIASVNGEVAAQADLMCTLRDIEPASAPADAEND